MRKFLGESYRWLKHKIKKKSTNSIKSNRYNEARYFSAGPKSIKIALYEKIVWLFFQARSLYVGFKLARKKRFDIYYGYEVLGVPSAFLLSRLFRKPFISRFQGTFLYPLMDVPLKKWLFWDHFLAFKLPAALVIMTDDGTQGDKLLKRLGIEDARLKFWRNGVNRFKHSDSFHPTEFKNSIGINSTTVVLMTLCKLAHWKRVDRAIKLIAMIKDQFPDICLLIIGDGEERESLKNLAHQLNCSSHVKFLGSKQHSEIVKFFQICDIFLSLYDLSNMGNPLYEAMIAGKCIVTLNNGTTSAIITNKFNGIIVELNDCEKNLAEEVSHLLANKFEQVRLGDNAQKFAASNFWTWEERIQEEIKAIQKIYERDNSN